MLWRWQKRPRNGTVSPDGNGSGNDRYWPPLALAAGRGAGALSVGLGAPTGAPADDFTGAGAAAEGVAGAGRGAAEGVPGAGRGAAEGAIVSGRGAATGAAAGRCAEAAAGLAGTTAPEGDGGPFTSCGAGMALGFGG